LGLPRLRATPRLYGPRQPGRRQSKSEALAGQNEAGEAGEAGDVLKHEWPGRVRLSFDLYEAGLSQWAQRSANSRGREYPEEPCTIRTPYQRDRDRIVHSKAFRRLKHKTQVFIAPEGDHYRTRLTHTLEVSGIARTAARALRLNEDLAEAIALGHDLGHTPFGHAGEGVIDEMLHHLGAGGFRHNEQSARVVEVLENDGRGLNLTWEVRDGIRHHSGEGRPATLEAQIVHLADRIAYVNHDIDDALRAELVSLADLPEGPIGLLGESGSERIDALVHDLVDSSVESDVITQTPAVGKAMDDLRNFLFETVYPQALEEAGGKRVQQLITQLMEHFLGHPEALPWAPLVIGDAETDRRELIRAVTDYVAGMTDRYAQRLYLELFMPKCWGDL
jgi:dGTPase